MLELLQSAHVQFEMSNSSINRFSGSRMIFTKIVGKINMGN